MAKQSRKPKKHLEGRSADAAVTVKALGAHVHDYNRIKAILASESDRAAAVLAGAYLDDLLERYLRRELDFSVLPLSSIERRSLETAYQHQGSLGTFSSRISMALLLKKIPVRVYRSLHLIREIRNYFAHNVAATSLDEEEVKPWVSRLWSLCPKTLRKPNPEGTKDTFETCVGRGVLDLALIAHLPKGRAEIDREWNCATF